MIATAWPVRNGSAAWRHYGKAGASDIIQVKIKTGMLSMDLRHLRHFVAVAEELHFARAAQRLGMAQPPLSQSIMRLEAALGVKLLERSNRKVTLTQAGAALLGEARRMLAQADLTERLVKRVAAGDLTRLRIGFVPMLAMAVLMQAVRTFQARWSGVDVHLSERTSAAQVDALRSGSLDLGVVIRSAVTDPDELELMTIERSSLIAAVPSGWPLAKRRRLRLADFARQPLVMFPQQTTQNFFAAFEAACRQAGFTPNVAQQAAQPYTMLNLVANEFGIGFVPQGARALRIEGVAYVPVDDLPESLANEAALAWMPKMLSPTLRAMIDIFAQVGGVARK